MLRCVQIGLSVVDLERLSLGMVYDMMTEYNNDDVCNTLTSQRKRIWIGCRAASILKRRKGRLFRRSFIL